MPFVTFATGPFGAISVTEAEAVAGAQAVLGHDFHNPLLLSTALTHSSVADTRLVSNERLEFLGDAVLGLVVCDEFYRRFPEWLEGDLTKAKSVVVSRRICAIIADDLGLTRLLILGNGIDANSELPTSLRAAVLEAAIGAIFLDAGFERAREFVLSAVSKHVEDCAASANRENHKSELQQQVQRYLGTTPQYEALDEQGPDHSKCFEVCVVIQGERFPAAWGPSKKDAEQEAARRALTTLVAEDRIPAP